MSDKTKFTLYLTKELRDELEKACMADNYSSRTEFVEKALRFYLDHRAMESAGELLPRAVSAAIEGRLGVFENRISSLLFKQTVVLDELTGIIAEDADLDEDELRRRRAESVNNVKATNGLISFENAVRRRSEY